MSAQQFGDQISISDISSHLIKQLRSHDISTTEVQLILQVLTERGKGFSEDILSHQSEVRKLQAALSRHQAAIIALENKQKAVGRCTHACHSLLSPIRRLPVEILGEVFIHFCDEVEITLWSSTTSVAPLVLAAVCSAWREVVFSASQLWTRIRLGLMACRNSSHDSLRHSEFLVNVALERSQNAPLVIDLCGPLVDDLMPTEHGLVVSIMKSFARHSSRWCHASLDLPDYLLGEMNPLIRDLPLLECLEVSRGFLPFDMTDTVPKLRSLDLSLLVSDATSPTNFEVPWNKVSTLKVGYHEDDDGSFSNLLPFVELCTSLQKLDIGFFESTAQEDRVPTVLNIHTLILSNLYHFSYLEQVLSMLTLPRLAHLSLSSELEADWTWSEVHGSLVENFLSRSLCTITSLELDQIPISDNHLVSLLQLLPSVEELTIEDLNSESDNAITDLLIDSLNISHSSPFTNAQLRRPLLSNLQDIELKMEEDQAPSCKALIEFVKSRWLPDLVDASDLGVACLKSVAFRFESSSDYDFSPLVCLRDEGLKFTTGIIED